MYVFGAVRYAFHDRAEDVPALVLERHAPDRSGEEVIRIGISVALLEIKHHQALGPDEHFRGFVVQHGVMADLESIGFQLLLRREVILEPFDDRARGNLPALHHVLPKGSHVGVASPFDDRGTLSEPQLIGRLGGKRSDDFTRIEYPSGELPGDAP